ERLEDIEDPFPVRLHPRRRDGEMLEEAESPEGERGTQVEALDVVVEVQRADENVEPFRERLQELADLVMVGLELEPRLGVPDLRAEVESQILVARGGARDEQDSD